MIIYKYFHVSCNIRDTKEIYVVYCFWSSERKVLTVCNTILGLQNE